MAKWWKISVILLLLGGGVVLGYRQVNKWHQRDKQSALERERARELVMQAKLKKEISDLKKELDLQKEAVLPKQQLEEVFGAETEAVLSATEEKSCEDLDRQVREFFSYLDKKHDLGRIKPAGGAYSLFQQMIGQMSGSLPLITGEMKDPANLMRNVAHFYRTLGRNEIRLVRDVLSREHELIEPVGALLFEWSTSGARCGSSKDKRPSLEVLYEYAAFFLDTLGGKSYLMRRDSKIRVLVTYYCILIIDRANDQMLNRHGIDILPHIEFSIYDMRTHQGLVSRMKYLKTLEGLRKKYERDRNGETS